MATQLFKLVVDVETTTYAVPEVQKYFYKLQETDRDTTTWTLTIPHSKFWNDSGNLLSNTNIVPKSTSNGYYLLFINGQLQQSTLFTVQSLGATVTISEASTIPVSAPITLVVNNFAPVSSNVVTT